MGRLSGILGITLALIAGLHIYAAQRWVGLYTHGCYLAFDALYFALAFELVILSFCLLRAQTTAWRAILGRSLLVAASLAFLLGTIDLYVIAFRCDTSGLGGIQCFTHLNWHKRYARSNQLGYWERDLSPYLDPNRSGDQLVIAALGDSWTWGQGVHGKQHRFTDVLDADLQTKSSGPVAVLNFGRAGADTTEELDMMKDVAKVKPDIVMICYLANDIDHYSRNVSITVDVPAFERRLSLLSPTYNFLYWRAIAPQTDWTSRAVNEFGDGYFQAICRAYRDPAIMEMHLKDIDALITRVRAIDAMPVFVIMPFPSLWQSGDSASGNRELRDQVYATIAKRARAHDVPVIETQSIEDEMSTQEFSLSMMDTHPNEKAHRRMAQIIGSEMSRQSLLQRPTGK